MFKAVVFDMDGVIFDSEKIYRKFQLEEGRKYGIPDDIMVRICENIAGGTKETNRTKFAEMSGIDVDYYVFREGVINNLDAYVATYGVELKPGVLETLEFLKENNIKIGLATSTARDRAIKYLRDHDIEKYFGGMVFGDMIKKGKPNPDIYLTACDLLGVKPENAIAVEDSINGIKSAHAAGMAPVMVIDLIQPTDEIKPHIYRIYDNMLQIKELLQ